MSDQRGHRWFAAFWDLMVKLESPKERQARRELAGAARGRVLEVGCGNGANFPYYGEAMSELIASDPDPFMLERAEKAAAKSDRRIEIRQASADALPFEDESFDTVICTLVLCSVPDQAKALAEIERVLKLGGQLRFLEHVRYKNRFGALAQDLVTPVWRWMGAGCHPNRDTGASIEAAGFVIEEIRAVRPVPPIPPMICSRLCIQGTALAT